MKKARQAAGLILTLVLLCMAFLTSAVSAAVYTAEIPVTIGVRGETGTAAGDIPNETYTIRLVSLDGEALSDSLEITGAGSGSFHLSFEDLGIYHFRIYQDVELLGEERGNYDETVYFITITVANTGVTVAAHKGSEDGDKADVSFDNSYDPVPRMALTVKKTWTDNKAKRPTSIKVQLLDGDRAVETVELTAESGWTYTWQELESSHSWDVRELKVKGYTAEYTRDGNTVKIHNVGYTEEKLIQTGQLNWPVPVLLILGLVLVLGGARLASKKKG